MPFAANLKSIRDTCPVDVIRTCLDERERIPVEVRKRGSGAPQAVRIKPCGSNT
jgi:hypothetical protein